MYSVASRLPLPSAISMAPIRTPGASGAKLTSTVQVVAALYVCALHSVTLASGLCTLKSSPVAPCVNILMDPMVVPALTSNVNDWFALAPTAVCAKLSEEGET